MTKPGFKISYHQLVVSRDIPHLDSSIAKRIKSAIEQKLMTTPAIYGFPLRGVLKPYWKLRIGDWRIVYTIVSRGVRIIAIAHRREIYSLVEKRI